MNLRKFLNEQKEDGFFVNIENATLNNSNWRDVLFTTNNNQLVIMSIPPMQELGEEIHPDGAQFIRVEGGQGTAVIGDMSYSLTDGSAVIIPSGIRHNIINTSDREDLRLYTIYSPPHHPSDTLQRTQGEEE